jgi:hypothetical protein
VYEYEELPTTSVTKTRLKDQSLDVLARLRETYFISSDTSASFKVKYIPYVWDLTGPLKKILENWGSISNFQRN